MILIDYIHNRTHSKPMTTISFSCIEVWVIYKWIIDTGILNINNEIITLFIDIKNNFLNRL